LKAGIEKKRKIIGKLLRSIRRTKDITQSQISSALGAKQPAIIQRVEAGTRGLDVAELWEICQVLEMSFVEMARQIDELIKKDNEKNEN